MTPMSLQYKKSRFNVELKENSHTYLFNSYTGALADIEAEDIILYTQGNFEKLAYLDRWLDMGFLVPRKLNETKMLKLMFEKNRFKQDLMLTVAPTLKCNCNCDYCFQEKSPIKMSPDIYAAIQDMIIGARAVSSSPVSLAWYGGEPFLCLEEIADFTRNLTRVLDRKSLHYSFVSNGTIHNPEALARISKNASIRGIQVSLDGPKQYHDKHRVHHDGSGTYDEIMANLPYLSKYGKLSIRINVDMHNLDMMEELFIDLEHKLTFKPDIYFSNIQRCNSNVKSDLQRYIGPIRFWESRNQLSKIAAKYNFSVQSFPRCFMGCTYTAQNAFVIDPSGNCYKCWDFIGNPEYVVGNILDYESIYQNPEYLRELSFNPYEAQDCPQCNMLPLCKSGCPAGMNGDLPGTDEHMSCLEIQNIFKRCIKEQIKLNEHNDMEVNHESIS